MTTLAGGVVRVVRSAAREFLEDDCTTQAAAIAYAAFFAIFPLMLVLIALAAPLIQSQTVRDQLLGSAIAYLPGSGDLIEATTAGVVEQRGSIGLIAVLLMLISALGVFQAVVHALSVVFEVPREQRGYVRSSLLALAMVVGMGSLIVSSLAIAAATESLWPSTRVVATILLGVATFGALYRIAPVASMAWRDIAPGAVVAALLFELAKWAFVVYLKEFTNYAAVYGAIGAVIALLTWCYVSAVILLFGAEVSSEYAKLRRPA